MLHQVTKTARANVVESISDVDWKDKTLSVRINGLDTGMWHQDIISLLSSKSERLDCIMIPKVGCFSDIYAVEALVTSLELETKRRKPVKFEAIIETAAGITNIDTIANASKRLGIH